MVIGGDADPLFPETHQIALASALPNAQRQNLPGVGHNPHWEVAADVANMILKFEAAVQQVRTGDKAKAVIAGLENAASVREPVDLTLERPYGLRSVRFI